jgi:hypothetical protein
LAGCGIILISRCIHRDRRPVLSHPLLAKCCRGGFGRWSYVGLNPGDLCADDKAGQFRWGERGLTYTFNFAIAGRPSADIVTSLGTTGIVDNGVRRIGRAYDDLGRLQTVTSYSDTAGTAYVNQVKYEYNGWGQVYREYQDHDGPVNGSTPFIQYNYEDGQVGGVAKYVRLTSVAYPSSRTVDYTYGPSGGLDDVLSRVGERRGPGALIDEEAAGSYCNS